MEDWIETGDLRLRYVVDGSGALDLLVLHTLRTQLEHSDPLVDELAATHRVHRIDLPGHGRSSKDEGLDYSANGMAHAVEATIDHIGAQRIAVVGESIGGALAWIAAARRPEQVVAVVSSNPYDSDDGAMIGGTLGRMVTPLAKRSKLIAQSDIPPVLRRVLAGGFADPGELDDDYVKLLARVASEEEGFGRAQREVLRASSSWAAIAEEEYGSVPGDLIATLVYGEEDWAVVPHRRANAERLPPITEAEEMAATGHFAFRENPAAVLAAIDATLTRLG
ncbi:MAG: alpha/beta fold hydrolase [Solirubrobacterales bacterium]